MAKIVTPKVGAMRRLGPLEQMAMGGVAKARAHKKLHPEIKLGPDQWSRMNEKYRGAVRAALMDACRHYECRKSDLEWAIYWPSMRVHVKKRERIEVSA